MDKMIQESVARLFCHTIKRDNKDLEVEKPLFCRFMKEDFDCDSNEAEKLLEKIMSKDSDNIDTHIAIVSNALYTEPYWKMNILKQLNHIIFKSNMRDEDYDFFYKVKDSFFKR